MFLGVNNLKVMLWPLRDFCMRVCGLTLHPGPLLVHSVGFIPS